MKAKNACESIIYNSQLNGRVRNIIKLYYKRANNIFKDAGWDFEDVSQELMMRLCEDKPIFDDRHCIIRVCDRLKDIIQSVYDSCHPSDGNGNRILGIVYDDISDMDIASTDNV